MIFTLFLFSLHIFYSFRHLWLICQEKTCAVCFPLCIFTYQFCSHFYKKFFHCCKILLVFYFCHYIHFFTEISIDLSRETIFCSDLQFFVYFWVFFNRTSSKITRKQLKSRPLTNLLYIHFIHFSGLFSIMSQQSIPFLQLYIILPIYVSTQRSIFKIPIPLFRISPFLIAIF